MRGQARVLPIGRDDLLGAAFSAGAARRRRLPYWPDDDERDAAFADWLGIMWRHHRETIEALGQEVIRVEFSKGWRS